MERDWSALPIDELASIFARLGAVDVFMYAGLVCHSWLDAAKLPGLWRYIDMAYLVDKDLKKFNREFLCTMAMVAVHRAAGRLEAFSARFFVSDELLLFIAERSPSLKSLTVTDSGVTDYGLEAVVVACPRLEHLHVSGCWEFEDDRALRAKCRGIQMLMLDPYYDDALLYDPETFDTDDECFGTGSLS